MRSLPAHFSFSRSSIPLVPPIKSRPLHIRLWAARRRLIISPQLARFVPTFLGFISSSSWFPLKSTINSDLVLKLQQTKMWLLGFSPFDTKDASFGIPQHPVQIFRPWYLIAPPSRSLVFCSNSPLAEKKWETRIAEKKKKVLSHISWILMCVAQLRKIAALTDKKKND